VRSASGQIGASPNSAASNPAATGLYSLPAEQSFSRFFYFQGTACCHIPAPIASDIADLPVGLFNYFGRQRRPRVGKVLDFRNDKRFILTHSTM
jgi:hypothetical protein